MSKKAIIFLVFSDTILLLLTLPINGKECVLNNTYLLNLRLDYIGHSLLFLRWMFLKPSKGLKIKPVQWFLFCLVFTSFTEFIQYFIPYRAFNLNDLLANSIGVICGAPLNYF